MSKLTLKLNTRAAAAIRQILYEHQKGYTYDEQSVPPRISDVRQVIQELDNQIEKSLS